jgi:16S rRNA processing protein RimM
MEWQDDTVIVGRVVGIFGIKGWIKLDSYTDPRENIEQYSPWLLRTGDRWTLFGVEAFQPHGKGLIAKLEGIDSRDEAASLAGRDIGIRPDQLPPLAEGEYYWHELIGLTVINRPGEVLGRVESLLQTGANDVLVVRRDGRELLIPYVPGRFIDAVDRQRGEIRVDWHREWVEDD